MNRGKVILRTEKFELTLKRLCHQLIEDYDNFEDVCLIGIQPRGVHLSDRIFEELKNLNQHNKIKYGKLDITFYRDDFRTRDKILNANKTEIDFLIEGKSVILADDVLYTGRTVQSALTALQQFGRPANVALITLVDRRFNRHLPIQSDYTGLRVDALDKAYVKVDWAQNGKSDRVLLYSEKRKKD